ncbi:MAG: sulfurtransferase complex subunit TusB [Promethearchaeota archaeon]
MTKILFFLTCRDKTGIELALEHEKESDQVTICLMQDAVYNANKTDILIQKFVKTSKLYVGKADVEKRGLKNYIHPKAKLLDYGEMIDLTFENENIINL